MAPNFMHVVLIMRISDVVHTHRQRMPASRRLTQQDIAKLTGVSQATVSLVLNGAAQRAGRIAPGDPGAGADAIRDTGYVADPSARRLADRATGSWACSPTSRLSRTRPPTSSTRSCSASRSRPSSVGCDLLLFTGAGQPDRSCSTRKAGCASPTAASCSARPSTGPNSRGWWRATIPSSPSAGATMRAAPCPTSAATTRAATAALVRQARELGHRRLAWLGSNGPAESPQDRWTWLHRGARRDLELVLRLPDPPADDGRGARRLAGQRRDRGLLRRTGRRGAPRTRRQGARAGPAGGCLAGRAGLAHPHRGSAHALRLVPHPARGDGPPGHRRCWCAASRAARRRRCSRCCCPASRSAATPSAPRSRTEPTHWNDTHARK